MAHTLDTARRRELETRVDQLLVKCGQILGQARNAQHLSLQEVVQEITHLDPKGLSKFERGRGKVTLKNFFWLVLLLDVPWEAFFTELPASVRQRLFTAILQAPPEVQESVSYLLWYGQQQQTRASASPVCPLCRSTALSS